MSHLVSPLIRHNRGWPSSPLSVSKEYANICRFCEVDDSDDYPKHSRHAGTPRPFLRNRPQAFGDAPNKGREPYEFGPAVANPEPATQPLYSPALRFLDRVCHGIPRVPHRRCNRRGPMGAAHYLVPSSPASWLIRSDAGLRRAALTGQVGGERTFAPGMAKEENDETADESPKRCRAPPP